MRVQDDPITVINQVNQPLVGCVCLHQMRPARGLLLERMFNMARVRKQYNCRKIADALSGRVWESAAEAAEELDCNKHVIYNSITRHHGVYTTQKGVDLILYYYQGHKLTPLILSLLL